MKNWKKTALALDKALETESKKVAEATAILEDIIDPDLRKTLGTIQYDIVRAIKILEGSHD